MVLSNLHPHLDRPALNQIAQDLISHCIIRQICHDRGIPIPSSVQPTQPSFSANAELLQSATQQLAVLKQNCQISALPIELLGQIHEQFLSTYWSTTRKAQGIYYTPVAIVDYLIHATLGTLLQNKTVEDLSQHPLRLLDPACGSGVFLLRAYQYLLQWYQTRYLAAIDRYRDYLYPHQDGIWSLTIATRQQILLRHIYGLDIHPHAVEVTKRSLLLQLGEGLTEQQIKKSIAANQDEPQHDLPNLELLSRNMQCGNALIDLDFYQLHPHLQSNPEVAHQINGFSWSDAFPEVMQSGGFEVIVGNPPWVFTRNAQFSDPIKRYYRIKYFSDYESPQKSPQESPQAPMRRSKAKQTGKVNLFVLFLFKFIELMHPDGRVGIVVPNTLLRTTVYETARKHILDRCSIEQIVDLGHQAFAKVTAASIALILGKNLAQSTVELVSSVDSKRLPPETVSHETLPHLTRSVVQKSDFFKNTSYVFSIWLNESQNQLFQNISAHSIAFRHLTAEIIEGIVCRKDQINHYPESDRHQKILEGKDITRYCIAFREKYILFDRQQLHRPRPDRIWHAKEKIILRRIGGGKLALVAALDTEHYYTFASTNNILLRSDHRYNIRYILALLNSRLLNCYYIQKFTNQSHLTVNIAKTFLEQLPIRSINFDCPTEKLQHDHLVDLVEYLHTLHQRLRVVSASEQQDLQQQIQQIDRQIDQRVYELYHLTETEIELVQLS